MKPIILFLICVFTVTFLNSQVKPTANKAVATKTIILTYQEAGTWGGEWSGLIFQAINGDKSEMRFLNKNNVGKEISEFWNVDVPQVDTNDPSAELHTNKANVGKKYKLNYTTKKVKYQGNDVGGAQVLTENVIISFESVASGETKATTGDISNTYDKATCKVYEKGVLKAIALDGKLYQIKKSGEKWDEKIIQNKNELCRGNICVKAIISKEGVLETYQLPNTTQKLLRGKIEGDQLLKYVTSPSGVGDYKKRDITFSGDKMQSALIVLVYEWFQ